MNQKTVVPLKEPAPIHQAPTFGIIPESQRAIAVQLLKKLGSALQIESLSVYVENDGVRSYTLSAKRGVVAVSAVVSITIPKSDAKP